MGLRVLWREGREEGSSVGGEGREKSSPREREERGRGEREGEERGREEARPLLAKGEAGEEALSLLARVEEEAL